MNIYNIRKATRLGQSRSEKVIDFYRANSDIDFFADVPGVGIHIVEVDTGSGIQTMLRVIVEISEHTTSRNIKDALPLITKLQNRLLEFQGSQSVDDNYLEALSELQESGQDSYKSIVDRINVTRIDTDEPGMSQRDLKDKIRNWRKGKIHKLMR